MMMEWGGGVLNFTIDSLFTTAKNMPGYTRRINLTIAYKYIIRMHVLNVTKTDTSNLQGFNVPEGAFYSYSETHACTL